MSPLPPGVEPRTVVVLGGGAPNGAMMAGALAAIYEGGKTFNTIYTSGAGALIGMLYAAPNTDTLPPLPSRGSGTAPPDPTIRALRLTQEFGISDEIYRWCPIGYKTFYKGGPFTRQWIEGARAFKIGDRNDDGTLNRYRRIYNDLVDFWAAATCPTDVTPQSQGLCGDFPFISDIVDFDRLNNTPGLRFYMNAHRIETTRMEEFGPGEITEDHFDAALSYPFIYPPKTIVDANGVAKSYFEGGCVDPLNLEALADHIESGAIVTRTVLVVDILSTIEPSLVRVPKDLWDAFGISIMLPVVSLARMSQTIFDMRMQAWNSAHPPEEQIETVKLSFDVPASASPHITDWSASNMLQCWSIGWEAGERFLADENAYGRMAAHVQGSPVPEPWTPGGDRGGRSTRSPTRR